MVIDWRCQLVGYPGEVLTDMDYSIYPEGFYTVRLHMPSHSLGPSCDATLLSCMPTMCTCPLLCICCHRVCSRDHGLKHMLGNVL